MEREIRELIREMSREVIRVMNREMQELKEDVIREMNREMNRQMQELKEDMIREMNRGMDRQMQELKANMIPEMNRKMQELKADMIRDMQRLVRNSSAEGNVNARCSLDHQLKKSKERELRLVFANQLPDKIFTRDKIRDIQIKLIDTVSWETVELDPLSSIEIEIVVLDGDFGSEGNENWTEQEFNTKIVQQRKTGPLVKGKQNITLRKGVGIIEDLSFFDNSSWNACGKFRLGARVLQRSSMGQARIKEAISQAFAVRDYRGKRSKKLDLQSLDNDVSPSKKIKKDVKCLMHRTDLNKQIEILNDCSDSVVQDASCVVDFDPILSQTTDPPLHYELTAPSQGSTGMQNANNHASSYHGHKGGFSTADETVPNLASQPQVTSTGYPVNAQGVQSISNFHPPTNGVSRRNSSDQSNERSFHCSPNYNPLVTESSQFNHGPHPHFPAPQHASCVVDDESTVLHRGSTGMQNANNHASSSHGHEGGFLTAEETVPNLASQPQATSTGYPVNAQGVQSISNFHPPTNGVSEWNSSDQSNERGFHCSPNYNPLMTESSQINNRQHPHFPAAEHASIEYPVLLDFEIFLDI